MDDPTLPAEQTSPQQLTESAPRHSSGMPKGVVVVFALVALLLVGIGGYVLGAKEIKQTQSKSAVSPTISQPSPTTDPTTDWKSYINSSLKYSLLYPRDWNLKELGKLASSTSDLVALNPGSVINEASTIIIYGTTNSYNQELEKLSSAKKSIIVSGVEGVKSTTSNPEGSTTISIILPHGKKAIRIEGKQKYEDVLNLLLSNFKLTPTSPASEDKQAIDTNNWKTYINQAYGYSLKYVANPNLKEFSCSSQKAFTEGDDRFVLDEINSTFPKCGFGGYSWPINISIEDSQLSCNSEDGYSATKTQIIVSSVTATRCDKKYSGDLSQKGPERPDTNAYVFVPKNGKYYRFELGNQKYAETFQQILQTFKFTN